ncbi:pyridoxal phosphate-dependent aminotransferase [Nocardia sp. NPDC051570]|uniref:pyridoxal phosphate-dependent aminotransferase n=1 Tax=Nocardia sp. NPDC051570 TaxID=3364324 RepID=UPI00379094B2
MELPGPAFAFDTDRVYRAVADTGARSVIITSPNNPTGRAVPSHDVLRLDKLLVPHAATVVVDESFVDFSDDEASLEPFLDDYHNLVIVKSMSKAYGVAGLRLGYLATADAELLRRVRTALPIWNINGVAEEFLRHLPHFGDDFRRSLDRVRQARHRLIADLARHPGLRVLESDANFVLVHVAPPWTATRLVAELFSRYNILIKDCSGKPMADSAQYVRIAVRTEPENQRLVAAVFEICGA